MITIHYSSIVDAIIGQYYEDYIGSPIENDLWIRVLHIRRIREILTYIDLLLDDVYTKNGKEYIDIEGICTVEFSMKNQTEILIKNIYFK